MHVQKKNEIEIQKFSTFIEIETETEIEIEIETEIETKNSLVMMHL